MPSTNIKPHFKVGETTSHKQISVRLGTSGPRHATATWSSKSLAIPEKLSQKVLIQIALRQT